MKNRRYQINNSAAAAAACGDYLLELNNKDTTSISRLCRS